MHLKRWIHLLSILFLIIVACLLLGGLWMNSTTCISTSFHPLWPFWLKCLPTESFWLAFQMLLKCWLNLSLTLGLAYILYVAPFTGDCIYHILASTWDIHHSSILVFGHIAFDETCFVKVWAVSTGCWSITVGMASREFFVLQFSGAFAFARQWLGISSGQISVAMCG